MISKRLQQVIDDLGWTQERLAKEMVTSPSTVSRWLSGKPISKTSLRRISAVTGVSAEWLLTGKGLMVDQAGQGGSGGEPPAAKTQQTGKIPATIQSGRHGSGKSNIRGKGTLSRPEAANKEINVHEGVMMTTKVLSSNTGYANALWHNLKSFDAAVDREAEMGEMKEMMAKLAEDNRVMLEKMERMEKAIVAPEGSTKKRDKAANS